MTGEFISRENGDCSEGVGLDLNGRILEKMNNVLRVNVYTPDATLSG